MLALPHKKFGNGTARIGSKVLKRGNIGCGRNHNDSKILAVETGQLSLQFNDGAFFLANGNINTIDLGVGSGPLRGNLGKFAQALFVGRPSPGTGKVAAASFTLVDNGIDSNGSFASLAIPDNQFSLAAANGNQTVNGLEAGLEGLVNGFARDDARSFDFDQPFTQRAGKGACPVQGDTEGIKNTTQKAKSGGNGENVAGAGHLVTGIDSHVGTHENNAHIVPLKVKGKAADTVGEANNLAGFNGTKTVNSGDTIGKR